MIKAIIFIIVAGVVLLVIGYFPKVGYNITGSVPIGFYRLQPIKNPSSIQIGTYVTFCLPDDIARIGKKAGYLQEGGCQGGTQPLIKKVIAMPSNEVVLSNSNITVNGHIYHAPVQSEDQRHHVIKRFIHNGGYIAKRVWVYGDGDIQHSWDSRYYGGVPLEFIKNQAIPLLTFS